MLAVGGEGDDVVVSKGKGNLADRSVLDRGDRVLLSDSSQRLTSRQSVSNI